MVSLVLVFQLSTLKIPFVLLIEYKVSCFYNVRVEHNDTV